MYESRVPSKSPDLARTAKQRCTLGTVIISLSNKIRLRDEALCRTRGCTLTKFQGSHAVPLKSAAQSGYAVAGYPASECHGNIFRHDGCRRIHGNLWLLVCVVLRWLSTLLILFVISGAKTVSCHEVRGVFYTVWAVSGLIVR